MKTPSARPNALTWIRVSLFSICILGVTPRLSADITLNTRLSDAQAYAEANHLVNSPPAQTQTDFQPASLTNSAHAHPSEGGAADSNSTSNSSIVTDNPTGSLRVMGDGTASTFAAGFAHGHASAKLIELTFTLSGGDYSYSLTGQLSGNDCSVCNAGGVDIATLKKGATTLFTVTTPPNATLSQIGTLTPGTYTVSIELSASVVELCCSSGTAAGNFTFALDPVATPTPTATPSAAPTSTPVDCGARATISGSVFNCSAPLPTATPPANPTPAPPVPVPGVLITASGSSPSVSATTDDSGNYSLTVLAAFGTTYTVTPSKGPLAPGSGSINTTDVLAIERHFLGATIIPAGCRLNAADVVIDGAINTQDVIATQRFYLGLSTGIGSAGQYKFLPANKILSLNDCSVSTQNNFNTYVVGDVTAPIANRSSAR